MEFDFSSSDINMSICSAQEGSPKNEGCLHVFLHIKYYKIYGNKKVLHFYQNVLSDSCRVADRLVGQLQTHRCWCECWIVKLVKDLFGMTLTLAPRSHNAFSKFWLPIEQSIVGHTGSFLTGEVFRMATLHSSIKLITSVEGSGLLLLRISLRHFA